MNEGPQSWGLEALGTSRVDQLARIEEAGLIRQGRVFLLSLEPIKIEMGAKWAGRSELVWDTMLKALARRMPAPDVFIQIDDATVLAAVVSVDAYDGQVGCAEVLGSTLKFFLGRSVEGDLKISRVSGLRNGALSGDPINLAAPAPPRPRPKTLPDTSTEPPPGARNGERWRPPLAGRSVAAPFLSQARGMVALRFEIVPVWRLDQGVIGAYAIRRRLPARLDAYTDQDREQMDRALTDLLVPLLEEYRREGGVFALIAPGAFSSFSARRPRLEMIERCSSVQDVMRQAVMMEVDGIGVGAPSGRIQEMASMMKPFYRVLTACVRDIQEARAVSQDYGFNGMAIDAEHLSASKLEALIRTLRPLTPNLILHSVAKGYDEDRLRALGVSHVSYRDAEKPVEAARVSRKSRSGISPAGE